jgi:hypothetical protein
LWGDNDLEDDRLKRKAPSGRGFKHRDHSHLLKLWLANVIKFM